MNPKKSLRRLLVRVDEGAPGNGIAFVAGWKGHNARTVERAFREGLLVEVGPDLWQLTDAGRRAIR